MRFVLTVAVGGHFSLLRTVGFGLVRMCVSHYRISWVGFTLGLVVGRGDKLLVFWWVRVVLLLWSVYFCFAAGDFVTSQTGLSVSSA